MQLPLDWHGMGAYSAIEVHVMLNGDNLGGNAMNGKLMLYSCSVTGRTILAKTLKELVKVAGGGRISKMYVDKKDGTTVHCGYCVGSYWFTMYAPVELPA